jgi:hypothetical protein
MLDMYRAAANQLKLSLSPTDLLKDVLEPEPGILHERDKRRSIFVDCSESLIVTNVLSLKPVYVCWS